MRGLGAWAAVVSALVGCAPEEMEPVQAERLGGASSRLEEENGLLLNGLINNGLMRNGLMRNGLMRNGLMRNGLDAAEFSTWFEEEPAVNSDIMKYVVSCALAEGQQRTYYSPSLGRTVTWHGSAGLAPGWTSGQEATLEEQQVVSACLGARVNKFGAHVVISLQGKSGAGQRLEYTQQELNSYSLREGCFFGNLFVEGGKLYAGNDGLSLSSNQSTLRVCSLDNGASQSQCEAFTYIGACSAHCTADADGPFYSSCSYEGTTYLRPLVTRLAPSQVASCGDAVCAPSEQSGMPGYCAADCG